jgi:DNA-directed RNA polymerase III subunit RPC6
VYAHIDEAGEDGLWSKTIKTKANLHDAVFAAAIKHLMSKNMISEMKSVEHPTRKMYIKSSLHPSDRATGGPWFTDGELDEEFIETVMRVLLKKINERSFQIGRSTRSPKKVIGRKMTAEETKNARDAGLGAREYADDDGDERAAKRKKLDKYLPMPAGYQGHLTLHELTLYIENGGAFAQTLGESDIKQLLDIMCFDGKIQAVIGGPDGVMYQALRKSLVDEDEQTSVLTEAPCGRCPVFDLCEEGGPVRPSNCEYFNEWLSM